MNTKTRVWCRTGWAQEEFHQRAPIEFRFFYLSSFFAPDFLASQKSIFLTHLHLFHVMKSERVCSRTFCPLPKRIIASYLQSCHNCPSILRFFFYRKTTEWSSLNILPEFVRSVNNRYLCNFTRNSALKGDDFMREGWVSSLQTQRQFWLRSNVGAFRGVVGAPFLGAFEAGLSDGRGSVRPVEGN